MNHFMLRIIKIKFKLLYYSVFYIKYIHNREKKKGKKEHIIIYPNFKGIYLFIFKFFLIFYLFIKAT
ncbi:hypothetical protein PFTANZ_03808 [Plasmodium falciparum Tanzania (2000708)]|uniref:Uncharacterized protein n=1 Tax=Plasmodium falciparum Tanzania (2000708) TaxID=1036725 RepID=A0A024W3N1_PLAFA|nr:hypothetical protein PFTANZ_03808 [Plasmodium falciparum Tanzania (2000708)]